MYGTMEELVEFIRNKKPMPDTAMQPFTVEKDNLGKAERIAEAK
jgi:hypothetical protein